jgi:hypothetical protein
MGLDMYDDIIDHSYDNITDPIERVYAAIYNNKELLSNNTSSRSRIDKILVNSLEKFSGAIEFFAYSLFNC